MKRLRVKISTEDDIYNYLQSSVRILSCNPMPLRSRTSLLPELLLFLALLTYFVLRAILVPVTHDEPATALHYAQMPVWDIIRYADPVPNNHILHTLLLKATEAVWGISQFCIRLPNLLGFAVYFWSAVAIGRTLESRGLSFALLLVLLLNPYLDDFFSLSRGYALSLDFLLLSCALTLRWLRSSRPVHLAWALLAAVLSAYSNFSTLYFCLPLMGLAVLLVLLRQRDYRPGPHLLIITGAAVLAFVLCVIPIRKMTATNQFQYWGSEGFYKETLTTLSYASFYGRTFPGSKAVTLLNLSVIVLFALMGIYLLVRSIRNKALWLQQPFTFFFLLLSGSVAIAILAQLLMGTPYLAGRTALMYYPLFVLTLFFCLEELFRKRPAVVTGFLPALILCVHFLHSINLRSTFEWWFDANNKEVLHYLREEHRKTGERAPFSFGCSWWFHPSISFYIKTGDAGQYLAEPVYSKEPDLSTRPLYYYAIKDEQAHMPPEYSPVLTFNGGDRILYRRK